MVISHQPVTILNVCINTYILKYMERGFRPYREGIFISSGARRSEILNLKYGSIKIDGAKIWLNLNGKTGRRKISLITNFLPSGV